MGILGASEEFRPPETSDADVVIYVTQYCGYCRMAERLLRRRDIPFDAIDVTGDRAGRSWLVEHTGRRTVPQIFIKGRSIGGYVELAAMDRSGELVEALAS